MYQETALGKAGLEMYQYQCHTRTQMYRLKCLSLAGRYSTSERFSLSEIGVYLDKYKIRIRQMYVHCTVVNVRYSRALVRSVDIFQTLDQSAGFLSDEGMEYAGHEKSRKKRPGTLRSRADCLVISKAQVSWKKRFAARHWVC